MIMGGSAAMPLRAVRRIVKNLGPAAALVVSLVSPAGARVATTISTLITIPPAKLPPLPPPAAPASAPVSGELSPIQLQILRDSQGTGLAVYGALTGKIDSAAAALLAVFAHSPIFDPAAVAQLLLADEDDRRAQALFTAMVGGAPVIGVAVAALGDPGGDVAIFYDDADTFPTSFVRLRQAFAPSAAVEIGVSDNSVYEADAAAENNADANWDEAIAAVAKGGEAPIDRQRAHAMADKLASDTGQRWRIVLPAALR
jgi:hypothetical protein